MLIDAQLLPDRTRRATVACLPEFVRDNDDRLAAGAQDLLEARESSRSRLQAECGEKVSGHELSVCSLEVIGGADGEGRHAEREQRRQGRQPGAQVEVLEP